MNDIKNIIPLILENPVEFAHSVSTTKLVEILKKLSYHYYHTDEPLVPDVIYDLLLEELENIDPSNNYLNTIGAPVSKEPVKLPYPMASLNKIKPDNNKLDKWLSQYKGPYVLSEKLDGVSCELYIDDNGTPELYTRGDSLYGQNITFLLPYVIPNNIITNIPNNTAIRGELIISKKNFEKINETYKNARNAVAGLVNSKNYSVKLAKLTDYVAYNIIFPSYKHSTQLKKLSSWNLNVVDYTISNELSNDILTEYFKNHRDSSIYNIDGIVVSDDSNKYISSESNPDYSFAFKMIISDQIADTTVLNVKWNISMHGYLKPIVNIKPVSLIGVTIKKVTANNAKYIVNNIIGPGAVIKIIRSNDVIPKIIKIIKPAANNKPMMPIIPYVWNDTNVDILIKNKNNKTSKNAIIIKQLDHFFKTLNIKYISIGIITKLVEAGYDSLQKILSADKNDLINIDGIGEKLINKIFNNINESLQSTNLQTIMAASLCFGRGIGIEKLTLVVENIPDILHKKYTEQELFDLIINIPGFADKTSKQFSKNFNNFLLFFNSLEKINTINISHIKNIKNNNKNNNNNNNNIFINKKIVLTGTRDKNVIDFIQQNLGTISNNISKNIDLVVYASTDHAKYNKAKELNINMLSLTEFKKKYNIS